MNDPALNDKTLNTLEFPKIVARLAGYCAFAVSADLARALRPTTDIEMARRRLAETSEAVALLASRPEMSIGGARDIRQPVDLARHGGTLAPSDLLDIKSTLISARSLWRAFERLEGQFPRLFEMALSFPPPLGLIDSITRTLSDRGEILDSASDKLANIRRELRIVHDRLLTKLQRMLSDPHVTPYLQENLVTQRDGRYVIPLRAEFKGRIKSIIHDQSSSGATLFVEPVSVVEQNNAYRELQLAERDEERRILYELSTQVGMHAENLLQAVQTIAELDLAFAKAKYSEDTAAVEARLHPIPGKSQGSPSRLPPTALGTSGAQGKHPGTIIRLYQARHPLLDPKTVVAIDIELDTQTYALVITGPNTGGKTVTLKTVGLLALMSQAGLHIPAHSGSELSAFEQIFADIGDEQSIEQSLSTFSSHINNIIRILEQATPRSLVILDELGAGTDPQEGAALARALLSHLLERGITTLVTTHHPELKAYAHAMPGVVNASVEFDLQTLRPTYHLTVGLPGRSNALAIASRLGMPQDIIAQARSELNPQDLHAEDLLDEIYRQRDVSRQARQAAEAARHEAEALRTQLSERLEHIEDERRAVLEKSRQQAESQLQELQEELDEARRALARARQPLEVVESVEEQLETLEEIYEKPVERRQPSVQEAVLRREVRLGDKVKLRSLDSQGVVTALGEEEAEVQVGSLRVRTRLSELVPLAGEPAGEKPERGKTTASFSTPASPGIELDLRGRSSDDALTELDRYLESAYLAGLPWVRIIHGKGTGKLRLAVRDALRQHPHVKSFEGGGEQEGGEGVTVAKLHGN